MNKKGNIFVGAVVALVILMVGFLMLNFIEPEITSAQNITNYNLPGLSCGNSTSPNLTISDGAKLACLTTEAVNPYFIIIIIATAGGIIAGKFLSGK